MPVKVSNAENNKMNVKIQVGILLFSGRWVDASKVYPIVERPKYNKYPKSSAPNLTSNKFNSQLIRQNFKVK